MSQFPAWGSRDTTILISPDSEFMRYFNNLEGKR